MAWEASWPVHSPAFYPGCGAPHSSDLKPSKVASERSASRIQLLIAASSLRPEACCRFPYRAYFHAVREATVGNESILISFASRRALSSAVSLWPAWDPSSHGFLSRVPAARVAETPPGRAAGTTEGVLGGGAPNGELNGRGGGGRFSSGAPIGGPDPWAAETPLGLMLEVSATTAADPQATGRADSTWSSRVCTSCCKWVASPWSWS